MRTLRGLALAALLAGVGFAAPGTPLAAQEIRYAEQIAAFEQRDRTAPPPKGGILFVGSSIFRLWSDLERQMAPLPVINRGFGGSRTWEVLHFMDRIVLPYEPAIIVYYCGSNDVNAGESADAIVARFQEFRERVARELPATRVFFVSINRSLDKRARWDVVDEANRKIRVLADLAETLDYIDVNPALFDARGEPRMELYLDDGLHFHPPAYEEFTRIVKPVLTAAWARRAGTE